MKVLCEISDTEIDAAEVAARIANDWAQGQITLPTKSHHKKAVSLTSHFTIHRTDESTAQKGPLGNRSQKDEMVHFSICQLDVHDE